MAFEKNKFKVVQKKKLAKSTLYVECNVNTEAEIDKVLSVSYCASVENTETQNGVVNFSGNIDLSLLCQTIDGEVVAVNSVCPFASKLEDDKITAESKVDVDCDIESYNLDLVTASSVKVTCVLQQSGTIVLSKDIETVEPADETICTKRGEIPLCAFIGKNAEQFNVESEISIKEEVVKVVSCESCVSVKEVESGIDFVSVAGEVLSRVVYFTANEKYETVSISEQFKEEVELSGVTRESISLGKACVKNREVRCETENLDKGVSLKITTPVVIKVSACEKKSVEIVQDLYSTKQELAVSTESFEMTRDLGGDYFEAKIDGSLNLDENSPRIDKVLFVAGTNLYLSNFYKQGDEVFIEGIAKANVVYLNDEVGNRSATIEIPFVVNNKCSADLDDIQITTQATLCDVDIIAKKGRDLYFDARLKIKLDYYADEVSALISNVELGEEEIERDSQIEVIFAKEGMTSWEIAKKNNIREELLVAQNPEVAFPLTKDEKIIVYFQK